MDARELNLMIAAIANYLYSTLSKKDFIFLNIFLSELSKSMFSMEILKGISIVERRIERNEKDKKD